MTDPADFVLCSDCFNDQGLRLDAVQIGIQVNSVCPNCRKKTGRKLTSRLLGELTHRFFVWGTVYRCEYGAAPQIQFNKTRDTEINPSPWLKADLHLIEKTIGVGFFHYGPRLWMIGEVEPLKALQRSSTRASIIERILADYPSLRLTTTQEFYRLRKRVKNPGNFAEYDSPPTSVWRSPPLGWWRLTRGRSYGRLDSKQLSVMYGSQDLQVCIHECRVSAEDEIFVATLAPTTDLKLLDLTELLKEEDATEFESLDMAVHMLFLAGDHSYPIAREIALAARRAGYNGLVYPSYFSLLRTGAMPFETSFGISHRRIDQQADREKSKIIPNLALFGRPLDEGSVALRCINKVILN